MEKIKAIILAAGEGTRMKSKKPKVLHEIFGKPMVTYVTEAVKQVGASEICVVIGHKGGQVQEVLAKEGVSFAEQKEQLGTGHAVMQAMDFIGEEEDVLILCGDTPLVTAATLEQLLVFHKKEKNAVTIISALADNPAGYGHIIRDEQGNFMKNVEYKDATEAEKLVNEINTGIYCFQGKYLKAALGKLNNHNVQKEYYLPDTLEILLKEGLGVNAMTTNDVSEFFGVNSRVQLEEATQILKNRINRTHMENGVTLVDAQNTYIGPNCIIGQDTVILPGCVVEGNTVIGEDCTIGPNSRLTDMVLKDNVTFQASTGMESSVGSHTTVGPFAYIRPNCVVGEHVKVGDFVELKNSNVGDGTKISHLTYIGDTDAGKKINFGCGTVTVNYDGQKKFRTVVEDNVFVGCNANLVAPVTVGEGSYVAAGSTITKDVPKETLAVARERQVNLAGWVEKRNKK